MAKKVVATLKKEATGKEVVKVVRAIKSPKTGSYAFKEEFVLADQVADYFSKK